MTHFTGLALIDEDHTQTCQEQVASLLAPFDSHRKVAEHIIQTFDEWLSEERCQLREHIKDGHPRKEEMKRQLALDDDALADLVMATGDYSYDRDRNRLSFRNPDERFDFYGFSSLRNDSFERHQGDTAAHVAGCLSNHSMFVPVAAVYRDGGKPVWREEARIGWWGGSEALMSEREWRRDLISLLRGRPRSTVIFVNFHI